MDAHTHTPHIGSILTKISKLNRNIISLMNVKQPISICNKRRSITVLVPSTHTHTTKAIWTLYACIPSSYVQLTSHYNCGENYIAESKYVQI